MAVKNYKRINYKSDFILTLESDAGWATPFCIKFWNGAPALSYYAGWDGTTYTHCAPVAGDPKKLAVQFDDHHLPCGELKYQIGYHFTVDDFPNDTEDEVINAADVVVEIDGTEYQVMLDFNGETAPDIMFALPAYANEATRISNELQREQNESQRIANEQARVAAEQERQTDSAAAVRNANTAASNANNAATLANQKAGLAQEAATNANNKATAANDAANRANAAAGRVESAVQQASNVNAQLEGSVIIITDKNGVSESMNVEDALAPIIGDINSVLDNINGEII